MKTNVKILSEKQIQDRLYGEYHSRVNSSSSSVSTVPAGSGFELERPSAIQEFLLYIKSVLAQIRLPSARSLAYFPWGFAVVVLAVLVVSTGAFQAVSYLYDAEKKRPVKEIKQAVNVESLMARPAKIAAPVDTVSESTSPVKPARFAGETKALSEPPASKAFNTERPRYYAVQICTYQKESDAKQLTEELRELQYDPFYIPMKSRERGTAYYVVFLGRDDTFAGAQSILKKFRSQELFNTFSDSFIRSL